MGINLQMYMAIKRLGAGMEPSGYELHIFRYILDPMFKNSLPKSKQLHELYADEMRPKFGNDQALALVWFGLTVIGTVNPSPLECLFKSDTTLNITDGEVLYRKMLVDVARKLSSDVKKSKDFIQFVISTQKLEDCPNASQFMPPQERQDTPNAFLPCITKLFEEANDQCVIDPTDLTSLKEWLSACKFHKITRDIEKFKPNENFRKECELVGIYIVGFTRACTFYIVLQLQLV